MKTLIRVSVLMAVLLISSFGNVNSSICTGNGKQLQMDGEIIILEQRSLPVVKPIAVTQFDYALLVEITKCIGAVDIKISTLGQEVYSDSMDFTAPTKFSIYTGDLAPGDYLLEFTNTLGGHVYGEFTIE